MQEHFIENSNICPFCAEKALCTQKIRLFRELPEKSQDALVSHAVHSHRSKGEILADEGDPIHSVIVIRKGRIKTVRFDANGEEYILDILHDGQAIWHDMFLQDATYHYSIVCLTDAEICEIGRDEFMSILKTQPETAMSLITMLSTELEEAKEKGMLLSIRSPLIRLAGFLLDKDMKCTGREINMKLEDIAASISLRAETISRGISKLEKEGMIQRKGQGRLEVVDRRKLTDLFNEGK